MRICPWSAHVAPPALAVLLASAGPARVGAAPTPSYQAEAPVLGPSEAAAALPHFAGGVVAFGDSLSDNGNGTYLWTNRTWPHDPAYYNGRFSNGPTWIEEVALALERSTQPPHTTPLLDQNLQDMAYGGSTVNNSRVQGYTGIDSTIPVPAVLDVVAQFLDRHAGCPMADTLFMVSGGGNDAFYGLSKPHVDPVELADGVAEDLFAAIEILRNSGARHFLLPIPPAMERTPYAINIAPLALKTRFQEYSRALATSLRRRAERCSRGRGRGGEIWLTVFRENELLALPPRAAGSLAIQAANGSGAPRDGDDEGEDVASDRGQASELPGRARPLSPRRPSPPFDDYTTPCLVGAYGEAEERTLCKDPDAHAFWDLYHPSARAHRLIAEAALRALRATYASE